MLPDQKNEHLALRAKHRLPKGGEKAGSRGKQGRKNRKVSRDGGDGLKTTYEGGANMYRRRQKAGGKEKRNEKKTLQGTTDSINKNALPNGISGKSL